MPGPTLDQGQLQSQVNWLKNHGPISWQNFRYSPLLQIQTNQNGTIGVFFEPAFDNELLGFGVTLDYSGGIRRWVIGSWDLFPIGFLVNVWDPYNLAPVANTTVGIYYVAVGR